jgi:CRP/FNR family cyclic AMP-dependent transcriptional regulator
VEPLLTQLSRNRALRGIEERNLSAFARVCKAHHFSAGQMILERGERSDDVFFILDGVVRVVIYSVNGDAVIFRDMGADESFGEISAFEKSPRSAGIVAVTSAQIAQAPGAGFRDLVDRDRAAMRALLLRSLELVRDLTGRIHEFSTLAVQNRIQAELLRLARNGRIDANKAEISPLPNHSDIAGRISTHREAVSRELSRLTKAGLLERRRKTLVINDVRRLAALVEVAVGE